jgi:hypothetical protein
MPPQLKTLIPLFLLFIGLFLVARHFLVPESFGQYGHYRGNSIKENAGRSVNYSGKIACVECHTDINDKLSSDKHAGLSCEVCHGPGAMHILNPDSAKLVKPTAREFCGNCHAKFPARPKNAIKQVDIKEHHIDKVNCTDCHNPHAVWELKN